MQHENIIILMIIFNFCMIQVYELQNVDIMQQLSKYRLTIKSVKFAFSALTLLTLKGPLNRCVCVCACVCVLGVTQGHQQCHHSIVHIQLPMRL